MRRVGPGPGADATQAGRPLQRRWGRRRRRLRSGVLLPVGRLGEDCVGESGYSDVGAVAGATAPEALHAVRAPLPRAFLLVPGYGAQGGSADDLAGLRSGEAAGVVVNASRSIIYAWRGSDREYEAAAADAARSMRDELVGVLGA